MNELDSTRRSALRARAHRLAPVVQIGAKGLTPEVVAEIGRALAAHELIKVRVADAGHDERELLLAEICTRCGAQAVQHIGKVLVLFREKPAPPPKRAAAAKGARTRAPKRPAAARNGRRGSRSTARRPASAARPRRSPPSRSPRGRAKR
jgi:putative YhbY family RNA-binding protein